MRTSLSFFRLLDKKVAYSTEELQTVDNWLTITYDTNAGTYIVGIPGKNFESSSGQIKGEITIKSIIQIDTKLYECIGIADFCFYNTDIKKITLPNTLQNIGNYAFYGCKQLKELIFTGNSNINNIGDYAFAFCNQLNVAFSISSQSFSIGEFCFYFCENIKEINVAGADSIPIYAFANCKSLGKLTLPSSVTNINETSFYNLPSLNEIIVDKQSEQFKPNNLIIINNCLYYVNNDINFELVKVPALLTGELTIFHETNSIVNIWKYAFQYCKNIEGNLILIPDQSNDPSGSIRFTLEAQTFVSCYKIKTIEISKYVELIKYGAFLDFGLEFEGFTVDQENEIYKIYQDTGILINLLSTEIVYCPPNEVDFLKSLPQTIETLCDYCFSNNQANINELYLSNIKYVGEGCFYSCPNLIGPVTLNPSLTSIPSYLFYNCPLLNSINFPTNLKEIGGYAFYGCTKLVINGQIPISIEYIGEYCFYNCQMFTGFLILPINLKEIKAHSFESTQISQVIIPETVTIIEEYAFSQCSALSGQFDSGLGTQIIQNNAFDDCNQIQTFIIHSALTSIDFSIFNTLAGLTTIIIDSEHQVYKEYGKAIYSNDYKTIYKYPNAMLQSPILHSNCEIINEYCFYGSFFTCAFIIPSNIKEIKAHAFENSKICGISFHSQATTSTSRIILSSDHFSTGYYSSSYFNTKATTTALELIGDYAFSNSQISGLLEIPNTIKAIGDYAFHNCDKLSIISLGTNSNIGEYSFAGLATGVSIYYYGEDNTTQINAFDDGTIIKVPTTYKSDNFLGYSSEKTDVPYNKDNLGDIEYCQSPILAEDETGENPENPDDSSSSDFNLPSDSSSSENEDNEPDPSTGNPETDPDDGNSIILIIGIVAIILFVALIVVVSIFIFLHLRKKKKHKEEIAEYNKEEKEPEAIPIITSISQTSGDVPTLVTRTNQTFDDFDDDSYSTDT